MPFTFQQDNPTAQPPYLSTREGLLYELLLAVKGGNGNGGFIANNFIISGTFDKNNPATVAIDANTLVFVVVCYSNVSMVVNAGTSNGGTEILDNVSIDNSISDASNQIVYFKSGANLYFSTNSNGTANYKIYKITG